MQSTYHSYVPEGCDFDSNTNTSINTNTSTNTNTNTSISTKFIGKDRDPLIRDPLFLSSLSLIKAILSLIDSYISLLSLIKAICQRVSK